MVKVSCSSKNVFKNSLKNYCFILLSLLTRDEEIEGKELRSAEAANCFIQEAGRARELR